MIFISHASADKPVVSLIVNNILKNAFRIANNKIFFSSEKETGMDSGDYINGKIFKKINKSNYILFILSPRYLDSHYCLCEMGAAKVLDKKVFLLVLPELKFKDVKGVYPEHLMEHLSEDSLDHLIESIRKNCKDICREDSTLEFKRAVRKCVKELEATLASLPPRKSVSVEEHEDLKKMSDEMNVLLDRQEQEISRLQTMLDEIDAGADPKLVKKTHQSVNVKKTFEEVWENAMEQLSKLTRDGLVAFFYLYSQDPHSADRMIAEEQLNIDTEVRKKLINANEGELYELGQKADPIVDAIDNLAYFLNDENAGEVAKDYNVTAKEVDEFLELLAERLDCPLDLTDEEFWDAAIFNKANIHKILAD